jgi:integrase/recombinase XerD
LDKLQQCFYSARMDLEDLLRSWTLSLRAEHLSRNYVRLCTTSLRTYISAGYTTLDKRSVQEFLGTIESSATANVKCRMLKRFSRWLAEEGETKTDVLAALKPPAVRERMVLKMPGDEIERLLKACSGNDFRSKRDAALIAFGLATGARANEVLGMRVDDVDMSRMIAVITVGKGGRGRIVPFGFHAARYLDRYLRARKKHPRASSEWLWIGGDGGQYTNHLVYNGMAASLRKRALDAGVEGFHYHRLRHSMASNWLAKGGTEGGLMAIAGWRSRAMLDRYTRDTASSRAIDEARRLMA